MTHVGSLAFSLVQGSRLNFQRPHEAPFLGVNFLQHPASRFRGARSPLRYLTLKSPLCKFQSEGRSESTSGSHFTTQNKSWYGKPLQTRSKRPVVPIASFLFLFTLSVLYIPVPSPDFHVLKAIFLLMLHTG